MVKNKTLGAVFLVLSNIASLVLIYLLPTLWRGIDEFYFQLPEEMAKGAMILTWPIALMSLFGLVASALIIASTAITDLVALFKRIRDAK